MPPNIDYLHSAMHTYKFSMGAGFHRSNLPTLDFRKRANLHSQDAFHPYSSSASSFAPGGAILLR